MPLTGSHNERSLRHEHPDPVPLVLLANIGSGAVVPTDSNSALGVVNRSEARAMVQPELGSGENQTCRRRGRAQSIDRAGRWMDKKITGGKCATRSDTMPFKNECYGAVDSQICRGAKKECDALYNAGASTPVLAVLRLGNFICSTT